MRTLLLLLGFMAAGSATAEPPARNHAGIEAFHNAAGIRDSAEALRLAQAEDEAEPDEEKKEEKTEKEPEPRSRAKGPPERFIPSEKISADSAVSFPADI